MSQVRRVPIHSHKRARGLLLTTRHGRGASHTSPWHLAHLAAASAFRCPSLRPARRRRALACAPGCRGAAAQESNTNSPAGNGPRRLARRLARAPPRAAMGRRCASAGCRARTGAGSAPSGRRLLPARRAQLASASFRAALAHISGLVFGVHGIAYRSHCQMCPTRRSHNSKIYPRRCGDAAVGWWEVDGSRPRGVCAFEGCVPRPRSARGRT